LLRRQILMVFGVVLWIRMTFTAFYFLKRKFAWSEMGAVISAVGLFQLGFALCGASTADPIGPLDYAGIALYFIGCYLNTGSELQRKRFKEDPANKGKLYTKGLFSLARHINYFGDTLWLIGWALLTRSWWSIIMPLAATSGFVFAFIPQLSVYLKEHYGSDYDEWASKTKRFIPFIY
jgi:steroid 5-alpha reductase family enzyme